MKIRVFRNGPLNQNCYIVASKTDECVVIDPGSDPVGICNFLNKFCLHPLAVICTHGHFDHIGGVFELQKQFGIPFYINEKDFALVKRANLYQFVFKSEKAIHIPMSYCNLTCNSKLRFNELEFQVIETPGHTDGSLCFKIGNALFTGDTIIAKKAGRFDLPGGNEKSLSLSVAGLVNCLPGSLTCYAGHGDPFKLESVKLTKSSGKSKRCE